MVDKVKNFYNSKPWKDLSYMLKVKSNFRCCRCGKIVRDAKQLIGHHTAELTEDNVDNASVSLNPQLIEIICLDCHNKEHRRFGHNQRHVYLVYGPPMAGKRTYVNSVARSGDIIVDIDKLWQAVSVSGKPNNVRFNTFALRDSLIDQIKTRYGQWVDAYIIGGYPDKAERERLVKMLGAEAIYIECDKDTCMSRADEQTKKYIIDWFDRFR